MSPLRHNRDVQVLANQYASYRQVKVGHFYDGHSEAPLRRRRYLALTSAIVVSSMRFEKAPLVVVPGAHLNQSAFHDFGQGRIVAGRMRIMIESRLRPAAHHYRPAHPSGAFAGCFHDVIDLIDLVSRSATKVRSTAETLIVGTRIENPSSLPLSSGKPVRPLPLRLCWLESATSLRIEPGAGHCGRRPSKPDHWCTHEWSS